jgi:hypothetical protein
MKHHTYCISKLKAVVVCLFSLMLWGCFNPQVIGNFQGLKSIQKDTQHLHIIVVHGISKHHPGWSGEFYQVLAESLGVKPVDNGWGDCTFIDGVGKVDDVSQCSDGSAPPKADGVLKSVTLKSADETKTVTITEVTWSPITTALKDTLLAYDKESDLSRMRAKINKSLRESLVDDGFSDALAYSGEAGKRIRDVVWKAICYSMTSKKDGSNSCDMGNGDHRFAFITHSLGSRIVFDALHVGEKEIKGATKSNNVSLLKKYETVARVSANTVAIYMLANQLPLLEIVGAPDGQEPGAAQKIQDASGAMSKQKMQKAPAMQTDSIGRFLEERRNAFPRMKTLNYIKGAEIPPVHIAAFSDPNDLLSYSLCKSGMSRLEGVEMADIWVKNAFNFVVFAWPMKAHQGYLTNDEVIKLLVGGDVIGKQACGG